MPDFIEPALATRRDEAPLGDKWVHEVKYDGWRVQAHLDGGEVTLFTRRGHNWTKQFYSVAANVERLPANKLILDGEVVAADAKGMPRYGALIEDLKPDQVRRLAYIVFDLLYMDGFDLRRAPPDEPRVGLLAKWFSHTHLRDMTTSAVDSVAIEPPLPNAQRFTRIGAFGTGLDVAFGAPLIGNAFDVVWRANCGNIALLGDWFEGSQK